MNGYRLRSPSGTHTYTHTLLKWWWCHKCRQFSSVWKNEHHTKPDDEMERYCHYHVYAKDHSGSSSNNFIFRWFSDVIGWSLVAPKGNWVSTRNQNRCTFQIQTGTEIDFHRINFIRNQPLLPILSSWFVRYVFIFSPICSIFIPAGDWASISTAVQWYSYCVHKTLASDWNRTSFSMSCKFTLYRYSRVNSSISQKCKSTSALMYECVFINEAQRLPFSAYSIRFCSILNFTSRYFLWNVIRYAKSII